MNPIPAEALDDRLFFAGIAGSGKTYTAMGRVEALIKSKARVIIPDPLGVWWGLRLMPDGITESGFNIVIFGGPHGDLPITKNAGALIGETAASMQESCIIDLSELGSDADERRFMLAFLNALYRRKTKEPVHLIFDEADMWAPQQVFDKEGDSMKLLGKMQTIVRRGRVRGFIPWLISQRPAVVSKNVLSQTDGLVALKLTSSQDRDAIGDWVKGSADKKQWAEVWGELPTKRTGQGLVWIPARGIMKMVDFPLKLTFDSSRTPKRGETVRSAALKPLNIDKLKTRLSAVEAETKANDPAVLRAEIARLTAELRKVPPPQKIDPKAFDRAEKAGFDNAMRLLDKTILSVAGYIEKTLKSMPDVINTAANTQKIESESRVIGAPLFPYKPEKTFTVVSSEHIASLTKGENICLTAIAGRPEGITQESLAVLTGYKKSSRNTYLQSLGAKGCTQRNGDRIQATDVGIMSLGNSYDPLPTGASLRGRVLGEITLGERKVLEILIAAYPNAVSGEAIDSETGYKKSSRNTYLQKLSARELVSVSKGVAMASPELFD